MAPEAWIPLIAMALLIAAFGGGWAARGAVADANMALKDAENTGLKAQLDQEKAARKRLGAAAKDYADEEADRADVRHVPDRVARRERLRMLAADDDPPAAPDMAPGPATAVEPGAGPPRARRVG